MQYPNRHVTVAGTFDHFHDGHRYLIDQALAIGEHVSIGVTDDKMTSEKKYIESVEPYKRRIKTVQNYLKDQSVTKQVTVFLLTDTTGIAVTDSTLDGIVVTQETRLNAERINELRKKRGLEELVVHEMPLQLAADGKPISSTRIRAGEIDRAGNPYLSVFQMRERYVISDDAREQLKVPFGDVISGREDQYEDAANQVVARIDQDQPPLVIAVGDIVSQAMLAVDYVPDVMILDNKTRRSQLSQQTVMPKYAYVHGPVPNAAGTIETGVALTIHHILSDSYHNSHTHILTIDGEEDLLGMPVMMLAPLGSVMLYGLYQQGMVYATVTEEQKRYVRSLL